MWDPVDALIYDCEIDARELATTRTTTTMELEDPEHEGDDERVIDEGDEDDDARERLDAVG